MIRCGSRSSNRSDGIIALMKRMAILEALIKSGRMDATRPDTGQTRTYLCAKSFLQYVTFASAGGSSLSKRTATHCIFLQSRGMAMARLAQK